MTTKTYDLGEGIYEKVFMSHPIHYKGKGERWEEIDTTITKKHNWEFSYSVEKNTYKVYFHDVTQENIHLVGVEFPGESGEEMWVNLKLKGAKPTEAHCEGSEFTFINCFDGVDVQYIMNPEKLKENIILNKPTDMREFEFTLKYEGVKLEKREGGLSLVAKGNIVWNIEAPYMEDADGNVSYGVEYVLDNDGEFDTLRVVIKDGYFLRNATYPIIVDPTINLEGTQDGVVLATKMGSGSSPPTTWSYNALPYFGVIGRSLNWHVSAIYFEQLDEIKQKIVDGTIVLTKAELKCYVKQTTGVYYLSTVNKKMGTGIIPSVDTSTRTRHDVSGVGWHTIDITNLINDKKTAFCGLYFDNTAYGNTTEFHSPFYSEVELRPKLVIQYLAKPTLGFHDGTNALGEWYSDSQGNVFKYLDFGTLTAGQTSLPKTVYLRNLSWFDVTNTSIRVSRPEMPKGVFLQLSKSNNPFIAEEYISYDGILPAGEDIVFFVRVATTEEADTGWNFTIRAKAVPHTA